MAERKSRKNGRPVAERVSSDSNGSSANDMTTALVRDITSADNEIAVESLRSIGTRGGTRNAQSLAKANESNITDEVKDIGPAFGNFVESVGMAVAKAQAELDKTLRETAKMLSEQTIDVIAVWEQQLSDATGEMEQGFAKKEKMPLVAYVMPTAYHWSRVYLEADMKVSEFNADHGFNIQQKSSHFNANARAGYSMFGGFSGGGSVGYGSSNNETNVHSSASIDTAAGNVHMEATLEPRGDIQLPRPYVVQKGPRLKVYIQDVKPIETADPNDATKKIITGREATLVVELKKANGDPNSGKNLEFRVDQPLVTFSTPNGTKTNTEGEVTITLRREGAAFDPAKPMPVGVRVWFGLVSELLGVQM
ncbi:MAG TPA: hypothetical protein VEQ42_11235 [Pyrinomonadaceae bacterium]|nr:hypothetical protein [Pyrinomonadaceae bacterium]